MLTSFSSKGEDIKYYGQLNIDGLADWVLKKIGLPDNKIYTIQVLLDKLRQSKLLVVFISKENEANNEFELYLTACRRLLKLDDIEFAFMFIEDMQSDLPLNEITGSQLYQQFGFGIRVYRRGKSSDYKDYNDKDVSVQSIEKFIYKSTFVGDGPDIIRSISTENVMKLFT